MLRKSHILAVLLLVVGLGFTCNLGELFSPQPSDTPILPTPSKTLLPLTFTPLSATLTRTPTLVPTATTTRTRTATPVASCEISALVNTTAYTRPSLAADVFGTVTTGDKLIALVKTSDNWYGFEPGVAQAGNVGVFRYRWVKGGPGLSINPLCANLRILDIVPLPGICYVMSMGSTPVRQTPSNSAAVIYTFTLGDYAQALGKYSTWIKVNLAISNISGLSVPGWVSQDQVGMNGCASPLPAVTP